MTKNTSQRQVFQSRALRLTALVALVAAELVAAKYAGEHAADPIGAVVLIGMAVMAGLCVALGPSYILSLHPSKRKWWRWGVVGAALVASCWNLSSVIDAQRIERQAEAIRSDPAFTGEVARLASLNRNIDALADETGLYGNGDETYANMLAERDRLQERVDRATEQSVTIASFPAWVRAFLFHGLVLGFSAAFALPAATAAASKQKGKRRGQVKRAGNVLRAQF